MKSLIFTDGANIRVEYVVDLLGSNTGNLTIMEIKGLDAVEEALFINFQKLPNNLAALKAFAVANNLQLIERDQNSSALLTIANPIATFNVNGGTPAPSAQTVAAGSLLSTPTPPTRASFVFGGWLTSSLTTWNFATNRINQSLTLTAKWTAA